MDNSPAVAPPLAVQLQVNVSPGPGVSVCGVLGVGLPHVAPTPFVPLMFRAFGKTVLMVPVEVRTMVTAKVPPGLTCVGLTPMVVPLSGPATAV